MEYLPYLSFLDRQKEPMISFLQELVQINSHSENIEGIKSVQLKIKEKARSLKCTAAFIRTPRVQTIDLLGVRSAKKYGDILKLQKRPESPFQILLMGHADTVYGKDSEFQHFRRVKETLYGPGVADMKGGLVILLSVLEAIERSPLKELIGWTALINGDEEIGSIASAEITAKVAAGKDLALVFEPQKEGKFVKKRPGSTNYMFTAKGRPAHAGRNFYQGINAVLPMAKLALKLGALSSKKKKIQVNVGAIRGGEALNVVPDFCALGVNIRSFTPVKIAKIPGVTMDVLTARPAFGLKRELQRELEECGKILKQTIKFTESGGVTDGNIIASAGVPVLDSMGIRGKGLHTVDEEADALSLVPSAKLAALLVLCKVRLYRPRPKTLNLDESETRSNRSAAPRTTRLAPGGQGEEEDRFDEVAARPNSKFLAEGGIHGI